MHRFSASLCQHPTRYGVGLGIPLLVVLRSASLLVRWAISPEQYNWITVYPVAYVLGLVAVSSLLMGAALGSVSASLAVAWLERDTGRLHHATRTALWIMFFLMAWAGLRFWFALQVLGASSPLTSLGLGGPSFIPWQVRWLVFSLAGDVALLWEVALVVTGVALARRVAYEDERTRQFESLSETG